VAFIGSLLFLRVAPQIWFAAWLAKTRSLGTGRLFGAYLRKIARFFDSDEFRSVNLAQFLVDRMTSRYPEVWKEHKTDGRLYK